MHIDIPEDLHNRLQHLAQDTGQDFDELLREAIETRLAVQERAGANLEGWTQEELRTAINEGIASGPRSPLDMDTVKRRARQEWEQSGVLSQLCDRTPITVRLAVAFGSPVSSRSMSAVSSEVVSHTSFVLQKERSDPHAQSTSW